MQHCPSSMAGQAAYHPHWILHHWYMHQHASPPQDQVPQFLCIYYPEGSLQEPQTTRAKNPQTGRSIIPPFSQEIYNPWGFGFCCKGMLGLPATHHVERRPFMYYMYASVSHHRRRLMQIYRPACDMRVIWVAHRLKGVRSRCQCTLPIWLWRWTTLVA